MPLTVNGRVHGGQQAVVGAQIQLYVAGDAGNASASSPLLNTTVLSGDDGGFSITGDYSCPSSTSQVYLVATQGNPGLGAGGNNPALAMMAPLGSCGNLSPTQFIWINEVTTVAAAYTLAPFSADITHIGSSATNYAGAGNTQSGLANAFLNAGLIVDTSTGNVPAALPSNLTTETGKIYALADAVAACINSAGASSPGCSALFTAATPSGGSAPTNTWDALMNIVKNPANNVAGVYGAIGSTPPFATTLTKAPNDWTLSLTVSGGGVATPTSLAVDSQGNVWVADYNGAVSAFSPQGTPLTGSPFGNTSILGEDFGLAVDPSDNVWVTVEQTPYHSNNTEGSLVRFYGASSGAQFGTSTVFSDNTINFPYAVAADSSGNIYIANNTVLASSGGTNAVRLDPATSTYTQLAGQGMVGGATALVPDGSDGTWITSTTDYSVTHINADGSLAAVVDCCGPTSAVALDTSGKVWMANSIDSSDSNDDADTGSVALLNADGSIVQDYITAGGITNPSGLVLDAAGDVWISNLHTKSGSGTRYETISELAGVPSGNAGTAISPSTGYGLDAQMLLPYGLAIDPSGNVWVSNKGGNDLVMFFGLAAPTKTPMPVTPTAP
ncbi:MAG TPA: hypothetical protein VMD97_01555 [Candidatus Aquilonibacter sp.]|nr:hypothetical protein [Candidatus Aquilonibacter sp.]